MEEFAIKQKIQNAVSEPKAPEELIQSVILRAQAVTMGRQARQQLETAPAEQVGELTAAAIVGQLAVMTQLPKGSQPQQLAQQLEQEPAFQAALRGGNVLQRLNSGELMRQIGNPAQEAEATAGKTAEPALDAEKEIPQLEVPQKHGPAL